MAYANIGTVLAAPVEERMARPSLFARIMQSVIDSRIRSTQRHLRARGLLVDETGVLLEGANKTADDAVLPFAR